MSVMSRIDRVYESALRIPFNDRSRIVLMSDIHRGDSSWADGFARNETLYQAALDCYYQEGFIYIELGDGDELWENNSFDEIVSVHRETFCQLSRFYAEGRLYMLYGNHDMVKRRPSFAEAATTQSECRGREEPLFPGIQVHQGLVLQHTPTAGELLLIHGHQADFFNWHLWFLARWLVRHIWRPLELLGVQDPTSAAKNYNKKWRIEHLLSDWASARPPLLVAGHTHRPSFAEPSEVGYFNTGSAVHPGSITAIEIIDGQIRLVKWIYKTRANGTVYVGRSIIAGPQSVWEYFPQQLKYAQLRKRQQEREQANNRRNP